MAAVSVRVEGLRELSRALRELPVRIARNDLQAATMAGAAVIRNEARLHAPVYTGKVSEGHPPPGTLRKAIVSKAIAELSTNTKRVAYVVVRHGKRFQHVGKKNINRDAYYWRFVEFGTKKMSARPFMRPAFEAKKREAVEAIKARLAERIAAHARDLAW